MTTECAMFYPLFTVAKAGHTIGPLVAGSLPFNSFLAFFMLLIG